MRFRCKNIVTNKEEVVEAATELAALDVIARKAGYAGYDQLPALMESPDAHQWMSDTFIVTEEPL